MTIRCYTIAALRGIIRAIDRVANMPEPILVALGCGAFLWVATILTLRTAPAWPWWAAIGAFPTALGTLIGLILLLCWLSTCYDRLRDWTERAYRECQKAQPPTPPISTP